MQGKCFQVLLELLQSLGEEVCRKMTLRSFLLSPLHFKSLHVFSMGWETCEPRGFTLRAGTETVAAVASRNSQFRDHMDKLFV